MICFVTSRAHRLTHRKIKEYPGVPRVEIWSYDRLFRSRRVPRATWILTDFDRLDFWELEMATHLYSEFANAGMRVFNNPALIGDRYLHLKQLHAAGFNGFRAWLAGAPGRPDRYPVFLRTNRAHRGVLTDLIETPEALDEELDRAVADGYPLRELLIVEYCAQPVTERLFSKLAAFRCGERIIQTIGVHAQHWCAKEGQRGVADAEVYENEFARIRDNTHAKALMKAFDITGITYGRADYTIIDGSVQIYEINTNPAMGVLNSHPYPIRIQSHRLFEERYAAALRKLDTTPKGRAVKLVDPIFKKQRRRNLRLFPSRWIP